MVRVNAEDGHVPTVGLAQTFQALNGGGLTSTIRTDHAKNFTLLNIKGNLIYSNCRSIGFA
jgi:hypothetical protein